MRLQADFSCGVLIIGTGLAGIRSAIAAAESGQSVLLCSAGALFSGSSFYPGTWGLGLIGPDGEADEEDLVDSICALGRGMASEKLVRSFVKGINPAIDELRAMGVQLKEAENKGEAEFIPCFDRKHRNWNGILFDSAREVFSRRLKELNVRVLEHCEAVTLTKNQDGRVDGAILSMADGLHFAAAGAVVLCGGGLGGLYQFRLTTDDVRATGHALALEAGAELTNVEFMQIMPSFVWPCPKTIFNEKTFRYLRMEGEPLSQELLELRSTHGPFTSRLADREVDFAILNRQGSDGVLCHYDPSLKENTPEFVKTYFDWLRDAKGVGMDDPFRIALYAHAANGGIRIDENGATCVPGLYAAGEITGGMHGADRIGGLSTANGLVFGARAGKAAASACHCPVRSEVEFTPLSLPETEEKQRTMRRLMTENALAVRTGEGLAAALDKISAMSAEARRAEDFDLNQMRAARQLLTAEAVLSAQLLRTESRGSHYRADYPSEDPACARPIRVSLHDGGIRAEFEK